MSFKLLLLAPDLDPTWPGKIRQAVPGVDVKAFADPRDAMDDIADADAAYGTVPPELLARGLKLRWICADRAGLGGAWFYDELVKGNVIVTNMRGSYNEHLGGHAVAFLLAFARRFDHYLPQKQWRRGPEMIDLPQKTVLIVGVGGAGGEASGLCAALGMRVLGIDPRVTEPPVGMADLATPDRLEERLGAADFVILRTPETPDTVEMFKHQAVRADEARRLLHQYRARSVCGDGRPGRGAALRPSRWSRARCRRSRAAARRPPALEHAKRADHAACRDLRHALSR
jgi:phosphoglycerate dehydrogenase-like enzyme